MSETRRVVLENGPFDGAEWDIEVQDPNDKLAEIFTASINGSRYQTSGREGIDGREVMEYLEAK